MCVFANSSSKPSYVLRHLPQRTRPLAAVGPTAASLTIARRRGAPLPSPIAARTTSPIAALPACGWWRRGGRRGRRWRGGCRRAQRYADVCTACEDSRLVVGIPSPTEGATVTLNITGDNDSVYHQGDPGAMIVCISCAGCARTWKVMPECTIFKTKLSLLEAILCVRAIQAQAVLIHAAVVHRDHPSDLDCFAGSVARLNLARGFQPARVSHLVRIAIWLRRYGRAWIQTSNTVSATAIRSRRVALAARQVAWLTCTVSLTLVRDAIVPIQWIIRTMDRSTGQWSCHPTMARCARDQGRHHERLHCSS